MALATGQFTIIDYSDAISLSGYLSSNKSKNIMYSPDTKTSVPEFSTGNMVITPSIFAAGVATEICFNYLTQRISNQAWYYSADGAARVAINTAGTATVGDSTMWGVSLGVNGVSSPTLTVKKNPFGAASDSPAGPALAVTGITYIYECTYTDPNMTDLPLKFTASFDNTKNSNSASLANASAWAPLGNIFKNNLIATLTAQCDLWRGGGVDTTNVQYYWYKNDSSGNTTLTGNVSSGVKTIAVTSTSAFYIGQMIGITNGTNTEIVGPLTNVTGGLTWTAGSGLANAYLSANTTIYDGTAGNGWRLIVNGGWAGAITGASSTAGATDGTNTISIPAAAVLNYGTFKCGIKDVDSFSGPTYNQYFWDTITFNDQTDPVKVEIVSLNGSVFKNAQGSTVLIAKLFQNGNEIDTITGGAEPTPNNVISTLASAKPGTGTTTTWHMTTDTGLFTKGTGSGWGASLSAQAIANGGPYSKKYVWSIRDSTGANVNFGNTSTSASLNYDDPDCTQLTASGGTAAGKYRRGKWILINDVDINIKNTIQCDVS